MYTQERVCAPKSVSVHPRACLYTLERVCTPKSELSADEFLKLP